MNISLTDILAAIAIVVSIITYFRTNALTKEVTNKTLRKEYFDNIFLDFMLDTFPNKILNSIDLIQKASKKPDLPVSEIINSLEDEIINCLEKAKPYKYINENLYESFYELMSKVEDLIFEEIDLYENSQLTDDKYEEIVYALDNLGKDIYELMKDEYMC